MSDTGDGTRSRNIILARVPLAGAEYSRTYMDLLTRAIDQSYDFIMGPRVIQATGFNIQGFTENPVNLRPGEVFIDGGFLRVVREQDTFVATNLSETAVGDVTANVA